MKSPNKHILVVDDEGNTRLGLSAILKKEGYEISEAVDGCTAIEKIKKEKIDLVISDIKMPGMDGMEFLKRISKTNPSIKIIIMTAFGGVTSYMEAIENGAIEYINKPVNAKDLKHIVKKLLP